MPLSKERMREYQKMRRGKKGGKSLVEERFPAAQVGNSCTEPTVLLALIAKLEKRVSVLEGLEMRVAALESREVVEPVVRETQKRHVGPLGKSDPDLFKRVLAEKQRRLGL